MPIDPRVKKLLPIVPRGAWWRYGIITLMLVVGSGIMVLDPVLYGRMIDVIVDGLRAGTAATIPERIAMLLVLWVALFSINIVLNIVARYLLWHANNLTTQAFVRSAMHGMLLWSRERFSRLAAGRAIKVLGEAWDALSNIGSNVFEDILTTMLLFVTVLVAGFIIDWRLTLVSLAVFPLSVFLGLYAWRRADPRQEEVSTQWAGLYTYVGESVSNINVIQNFAQESARERTFGTLARDVLKKQLRLNVFWAFFYGSGSSLTMIARMVVFVAGVWMVAQGMTTLGALITFLGMLNFLLSPIQRTLGETLPRLSHAYTQLKLYAEMASEENDVVEQPGAKSLKDVRGNIILDRISFTYPEQSHHTLSSIALTIPAGTSCALVGPSGAGKSTLAKLINRTIDPTKGSVLIDGRDVREYTLPSLRRQIGVVTQETYLFHDTVFNNVRFVQPKATRDQVVAACKKAQAHTFISRLPNGYDSVVGERGVKLSGGERQRIALARIFLADPPILVLDESTSALDSETEKLVQESLQEVMRGRTTIVIAHRLSTIYLADQIAVVENGRIVDLGTHDELIKKGGLYDRLWSLQAGGYVR